MNPRSLAIIEAYTGKSFGSRQVNEVTTLKSNIGRLTHGPIVRIDAVRARSSEWAFASVFGASEWVDIPRDDVLLIGDQYSVQGGFLDSNFSEADVTYTVGYAELPANVRKACELLDERLDGSISSYSASAYITPEIAALLEEVNGN